MITFTGAHQWKSLIWWVSSWWISTCKFKPEVAGAKPKITIKEKKARLCAHIHLSPPRNMKNGRIQNDQKRKNLKRFFSLCVCVRRMREQQIVVAWPKVNRRKWSRDGDEDRMRRWLRSGERAGEKKKMVAMSSKSTNIFGHRRKRERAGNKGRNTRSNERENGKSTEDADECQNGRTAKSAGEKGGKRCVARTIC